jgi:hypothetical protein
MCLQGVGLNHRIRGTCKTTHTVPYALRAQSLLTGLVGPVQLYLYSPICFKGVGLNHWDGFTSYLLNIIKALPHGTGECSISDRVNVAFQIAVAVIRKIGSRRAYFCSPSSSQNNNEGLPLV